MEGTATIELANASVPRSERMDSLFHDLHPTELALITATQRIMRFAPGETIVHAHRRASGVYFVLSGTVKVSIFGRSGRERIIRVVSAGEALDYCTALSGAEYSAYATALSDTEIRMIPSSTFLTLCRSNQELAIRIINLLSAELKATEEEAAVCMQKSVSERVADALLNLFEKYGAEQDQSTMRIALTRVDLAKIIGTTTESVSRTLSKFQRDKMIALMGPKIRILNRRALLKVAARDY